MSLTSAGAEHVDHVDREHEPEEEEHADAPRGRVPAAVPVGMEEDGDARNRRDRVGDEELRRRELLEHRPQA